MTSRISKDGWAGVVGGLVIVIIGVLPYFSFTSAERAMFVGVGGVIAFLSSVYLTDDVEEPEGKLEIEKKVDGAKHA